MRLVILSNRQCAGPTYDQTIELSTEQFGFNYNAAWLVAKSPRTKGKSRAIDMPFGMRPILGGEKLDT